jgi:hypothetical protein
MHVPTRYIVACHAFVLLALPAAANAQNAGAMVPLLPEDREIRMARSAAAPQVSDNASVWVLRRGGHVKVVDGSNGVNCFVSRDANAEALYPICYDEEASRTILPISLMQSRLREAGKAEDEIDRTVDAAIARGELKLPARTALAWMLSADQIIYAGERRVGTWYPHIMIYSPNLDGADLGFPTANPPGVFVQNPGRPLAHLVVVTPLWSDGRAGPALAAPPGGS